MKKRRKFISNRRSGWMGFAFILMCLTACDDNDPWMPGDIPANGQTASYSNKLSAPIGGNELTLYYNGNPVIGKEAKFTRDQAGQGALTLCAIVPGQAEYTIGHIALIPAETGYTFAGSVSEQGGTGFTYKGKIEEKKLSVELSGVTVPANPLTGQWYTLPNPGEITDSSRTIGQELRWVTFCQTVYSQVGEFTEADGEALFDPEAIPSIVPLAFNLAINPILSSVVGTVLHDVTFQDDGNITASYAGLPDTLNIQHMMSGKGINRPASDWQQSPLNLATYYPADDSTIYVMPNVDMIIRQIEMNRSVRTKAAVPSEVIGGILGIYMQLSKWGTTGIKLNLRKNNLKNYTWMGDGRYVKYEGDYTVYIDKSEIEALFAVVDILKALVPAEMVDTPLDELLLANGIDIMQILRDRLGNEMAEMIHPVIHKFTVDKLLTQIKADLDEDPLQLGLWLSGVQVPVTQN